MPRSTLRTYSRYTAEAAALLGKRIRAARMERRLAAAEVAARAGISRGLVQRIEKGDLRCELGATFEVAAVVGVRLFDLEREGLRSELERVEDQLALLPKTARRRARKLVDDF
jgi:transcriptional regulator with XRE-family HTH domain